MNTLKASKTPTADIEKVSYPNQPIENKLYQTGYENYFEALPELSDADRLLSVKVETSAYVMDSLAAELVNDGFANALPPQANGFNRTILGMVAPVARQDGSLKEGQEIVLARWGDGKTSPVHGHGDGLLYEHLLTGKMRVNTYRVIDHEKRLARPIETKIFTGFEKIAIGYARAQEYPRSALVHNFTSIGNSASLHYVPEHTRDGRDNGFEVQHFENMLERIQLKQLNAQQGLEQLRIGDVALVRSENVPDYGDHFIVITGSPILKAHGLRPQDVAIHAPYAARILNQFKPIMGLTLLKLHPAIANWFLQFHGITINNKQLIFPTA